MGDLEIVPIGTPRERREFVDLAYRINADDPSWVPPLHMEAAELVTPGKNPFFEHADQARIKDLLVKQFCVVLHGPCTYDGRTMAEAHRGLNIREGNFYALVEELQIAMNKRGIPFSAQNRLVAALAPMHRDIIDR